MQLFAQAFWVGKAGNSDTEYEDAFWPRKPPDGEARRFPFAVADGATETSYSGIWAKQLVRAFCKGQLESPAIGSCLPGVQQRWCGIVRRLVRGRPLPWYAQEKMRVGAFAAVIGVTLYDEVSLEYRPGDWQAVALGDCCLVQMRGEEVLVRFPLDNSASFNNRPHLLSSNPAQNNRVLDRLRTIRGTWHADDAFYLMTDALACWFMREVEEGRTPWSIFRNLDTSDEIKPFREWVGDLRMDGMIRNDDVTLLRMNVA